ncbi:unnamed protein product, partial [Sphacelaria rigidula]
VQLLSPKAEFKCTATYTMSQKDVDSGQLVDTVATSGVG